MLDILLISPYHGGSHQAWAVGWQKASRHKLTLLTLPDRFWKWRMHGGAVTLARRFLAQNIRPDVLVATDMLDLTTFLALTRQQTANMPTAVYLHENQLTYPLPADGRTGPMRRQMGERDHHYAFINYASLLAADHIFFNSQYHLQSFFEALPKFLKHFPEYNELGSVADLQKKSQVLAVGIDFQRLEPPISNQDLAKPPLIVWNQRWEYDKNPEAFFAALLAMTERGFDFRVALCGQQYGKRPLIFDKSLEKLGSRVIHIGYADSTTYRQLLWEAATVVSTAHHEFFGISIWEAVYCRAFPLLPRRLSYPEILPEALHDACLYSDQDDLVNKLAWVLSHPGDLQEITQKAAAAVSTYDWQRLAPDYDDRMSSIAKNHQQKRKP